MFLLSLIDPSDLAPPAAPHRTQYATTVSAKERAQIINCAMRYIERGLSPDGWRSPEERAETRALLEAVDTSTLSRIELRAHFNMLTEECLHDLCAARGCPMYALKAGRHARRHVGQSQYINGL